jgi:hypothetical protein
MAEPKTAPRPNERERELALQVFNEYRRSDGTTPGLLTAIAKALAAYRVELGHKGDT